MAPEPSIPVLSSLLRDGQARVPTSWGLRGPEEAGLVWRIDATPEVVATPAFVRLATELPTEGEAIGALLATEPRYRGAWLDVESARLRELGIRDAIDSLCDAIDVAGPAAAAMRSRLGAARLAPTGFAELELAVFGGAADQPLAALPLRRVLGITAPRVEGGLGRPASALSPVHPRDPSVNWTSGRLLQSPGAPPEAARAAVLSGHVPACGADRMAWVLGTPWLALLSVLVFTAEAWAAERRGGVQLELPIEHVAAFGAPPRVDVVVTLADGREVLCGTLGELCVRVLDALAMALIPALLPTALDAALAPVIADLLRNGVWAWQSHARSRYAISDGFSFDCYRGVGHRYVYLGGDRLSQTIRSVCVGWARERLGDLEPRP